ncbi:MAG: hypothetical protein QM743_05575 [Chitinophagaceae bacterium]
MHYAEGLLLSLAQYVAKNRMDICFYVYHNRAVPSILEIAKSFPEHVTILSDAAVQFPAGYRLKHALSGIAAKIFSGIRLKNYIEKIIEVYQINIVHSPYQSIPDASNVLELVTQHDVPGISFSRIFHAGTTYSACY